MVRHKFLVLWFAKTLADFGINDIAALSLAKIPNGFEMNSLVDGPVTFLLDEIYRYSRPNRARMEFFRTTPGNESRSLSLPLGKACRPFES
jgi:hypothetical protein